MKIGLAPQNHNSLDPTHELPADLHGVPCQSRRLGTSRMGRLFLDDSAEWRPDRYRADDFLININATTTRDQAPTTRMSARSGMS